MTATIEPTTAAGALIEKAQLPVEPKQVPSVKLWRSQVR